MSELYNIPQDLYETPVYDTAIYFYSSDKSVIKNKITISHNLICFLFEGEKETFLTSSHTVIKNDQLFLIKNGSALISGKIVDNKTYESILMFFSNDLLLNFCLKFNINFTNKEKNKNTDSICLLKDDFILHFEQSLLSLKSQNLHDNQELLRLKFEELMYYIYEKNPIVTLAFIKEILQKDQDYNSFKKTVLSNIDKNLTLNEIAFLCNMSLSTFKRKFNQVFNESPQAYRTKKKMQEAKILLLKNLSPSEVYFKVGYENLSSFSTEFKKYYGLSPKQFTVKYKAEVMKTNT